MQVILQPYQTAVFAILITILVINYILNILYIIVFCKYIRKLLQDRQIDIISNYFVLFLGTISSFRFCLISFSKMFPKPNIWIENASQLTPVHYLCGISIINTILVLAATGTLIYNETALSYLFMLSIDLLVLTILNIFCSIWMIARNKPDEYFQTTKKYKFEEQYRTE